MNYIPFNLFFAISLLFIVSSGHSQCVLAVSEAALLTPCSADFNNFHESSVACDSNSKKWKNYNTAKLLDSIRGEYSVYSRNGLEGTTKIISIDTSYEHYQHWGPSFQFSKSFEASNLYAVKSTWNAQPRSVKTLSTTNTAYIQAIKTF